MPNITTVFFDLDNTLVDYYGSDQTGLTALKEQFFPQLSLEEFRETWRVSNVKNWALYEKGELTLEAQRIKRVQEVWQTFGHPVTEEEAQNIFQLYLEVFKNSVQLLPHAQEVLTTLHQKQLPMGIITNGGSTEQRRKLEVFKIKDFFQPDLIFISEEVGACKPELAIFQKAQTTSQSPAEGILYVGDMISHDIQPARSLNWNAVLIDHYSSKYEVQHDDSRITDLRDMLKLVM